MAFPAVAARTTTADASSLAVHPINLGGPNAGDLLIVFVSATSTGGAFIIDRDVSGNAWFLIGEGAGSNGRIATYAKIAAGGGGDALTLRTPSTCRAASACYRITGHGSTVAGGSTSTAVGTNGDPPAASFTGAAQDALWLTALNTSSSVASAAPAGYGTLTTASTTSSYISVAEKTANATTDNPGTFTNTSQDWTATTVAITEFAITTNLRQSQELVEAVSAVSPNLRASQVMVEAVSNIVPTLYASQVLVEMVSENVPNDSGDGPTLLFIAT